MAASVTQRSNSDFGSFNYVLCFYAALAFDQFFKEVEIRNAIKCISQSVIHNSN